MIIEKIPDKLAQLNVRDIKTMLADLKDPDLDAVLAQLYVPDLRTMLTNMETRDLEIVLAQYDNDLQAVLA